MNPTLYTAFANTRYQLWLADNAVTLTIGANVPDELKSWIERCAGHRCAWLITAHNPHAERIAPALNAARHALLLAWAQTRTLATLPAVNKDPDNVWPDEPGLFLAGIEEGMARALGRRFGQLAIVAVPAAQPVSLIWS